VTTETAAGSGAGLDPVIHAEARLRITAALAAVHRADRITFPRLQKLLGMTAGNLSTHLRKLEEAGYVEVTKTFQGRTPVTHLALTPRGRAAFDTYTTTLRALLDETAAAASIIDPGDDA
jgi:DNA-binding MarR family transcriptional regulator